MRLLLFSLFSLVAALSIAQGPASPDITAADTALFLKPIRKGFFKKDNSSPRNALICAIVPGGGQAYNRQYWKVPIVFGAIGGTFYYFVDQRNAYQSLKTEYIARLDNDPTTVPDPNLARASDFRIKQVRDVYRRRYESAGLFVVLSYLLSAAEAYTAAHLKSFDVSDDLSLRLGPTPNGIGLSMGMQRQVKRVALP